MIPVALFLLASSLPSSPDLGKTAGQCQPMEQRPAFLVNVFGLKDRRGQLKLELYPANDRDFLADDNLLIAAGKAFARVDIPVPAAGPVAMCIHAPAPGIYALTLLHDRDSNRRFSVSIDGIGFAGNPKLGFSKPSAASASARVGDGPTRITIILNYRKGLFSFGPLGH